MHFCAATHLCPNLSEARASFHVRYSLTCCQHCSYHSASPSTAGCTLGLMLCLLRLLMLVPPCPAPPQAIFVPLVHTTVYTSNFWEDCLTQAHFRSGVFHYLQAGQTRSPAERSIYLAGYFSSIFHKTYCKYYTGSILFPNHSPVISSLQFLFAGPLTGQQRPVKKTSQKLQCHRRIAG